MEADSQTWTAFRGRLSYKELFYWMVLLNVIFLISVLFGALAAYLSITFLPYSGVLPTIVVLVCSLTFWRLWILLKKKFQAQRHDLLLKSNGEILEFWGAGEKLFEERISDGNWTRLKGRGKKGSLMAFRFLDGGITVGCEHPSMAWLDGSETQHLPFVLAPSDFIRLVGELGLESEVER